jgi:Zn-dependent protease with chaperone function
MTLPRSAYSLGVSIEIGIHIAVVIAVYIPTLVIVFPAALMLTGAIMTANFAPDSGIALWLSSDSLEPLAASISIVLLIAIASVVTYLFRNKDQSERLKRLTGADGEKLDQLVSEMWAKISDRPAPDITWFPAFDIAGYAASHYGRPQLQVSAGLWQAAVSGNDTAKAIVAHELAHIKNNDPRTLKVIDIIRFSAANILSFVAVISLIVFCVVFVSEVSSAFAEVVSVARYFVGYSWSLGQQWLLLCFRSAGWRYDGTSASFILYWRSAQILMQRSGRKGERILPKPLLRARAFAELAAVNWLLHYYRTNCLTSRNGSV